MTISSNTFYNNENENNEDNDINDIEIKKKLFFELSLKEKFNRWSIVMINIINEITELLSLKKYNNFDKIMKC